MERVDVVIVGAGPTGLTAARTLTATGRSVVVLEARDRVGGRTWTDRIDGQMFEIGGQWISPDQTAILDLVDELGLSTFPGTATAIGSSSPPTAPAPSTPVTRSPSPSAGSRRWTASSATSTISPRA